MPLAADVAERVIQANRRFFKRCRALDIPIIHLVTTYRDVAEIRSNPFWRSIADNPSVTRKNAMRHNIAGSPGCEIIPALFDQQRD
jgi:biuret amidohydrolase